MTISFPDAVAMKHLHRKISVDDDNIALAVYLQIDKLAAFDAFVIVGCSDIEGV